MSVAESNSVTSIIPVLKPDQRITSSMAKFRAKGLPTMPNPHQLEAHGLYPTTPLPAGLAQTNPAAAIATALDVRPVYKRYRPPARRVSPQTRLPLFHLSNTTPGAQSAGCEPLLGAREGHHPRRRPQTDRRHRVSTIAAATPPTRWRTRINNHVTAPGKRLDGLRTRQGPSLFSSRLTYEHVLEDHPQGAKRRHAEA